MDYFSAIKRNELLSDTFYTGINLKNMLNEKNLTQMNTVCVIPTI